MEKAILREQLFQKYFDIQNGVLVSELTDRLSFISNTWKKLHILCKKNIKYFDRFSSLEKFKMVDHNNKKYLILKLRMWRYVIIDLDKMENISSDEFFDNFDEDFFVENFAEVKDNFFDLYHVQKYDGDIQELVNFYIENESVVNLSSEIHCRFNIGSAWTWLYIDFVNSQVQMGFQTCDQSLYEQLFFNYDLSPFSMQDAIHKMGIDKMNEIFSRVYGISIPAECIPFDLYKLYLDNKNIKKIL